MPWRSKWLRGWRRCRFGCIGVLCTCRRVCILGVGRELAEGVFEMEESA